jgi:opacity protein-like surface antigen
MKKLFFLGACLVALASQPVIAQTAAADIVVVKVSEGSGYLNFDIARPGSKPEHREFSLKQLKEKGESYYISGQAEYTRILLVELTQQGYTLTTTYNTNLGAVAGPTTLVFTKR